MRIGEVAHAAGVSVRSLRYYEEQGLLRPGRTTSGQRVYEVEAVEQVRIFQQFYAAGLSSRSIALLLPCIDSGTVNAAQRGMLGSERDRLAARIDELRDALARLDALIVFAGDDVTAGSSPGDRTPVDIPTTLYRA